MESQRGTRNPEAGHCEDDPVEVRWVLDMSVGGRVSSLCHRPPSESFKGPLERNAGLMDDRSERRTEFRFWARLSP